MRLGVNELVKPLQKGDILYDHYVYEAALTYFYFIQKLGMEHADDLLAKIQGMVTEELQKREEECN